MANIDIIEIPWDKFPQMKVWRVVRKNWTPAQGNHYVPADSKYKGYPRRKDALEEAKRLTEATGKPHRTIEAWMVAVAKAEA